MGSGGGMKKQMFLGIDLGTTFSVVSAFDGERIWTIPINQRSNKLASCVAFGKDGIIWYGEEAKDFGKREPKNVIFDVKRIMGMDFDDTMFQSDKKNWTFETQKNVNGRIEIVVPNKKTATSAEEVSQLILNKVSICLFVGFVDRNSTFKGNFLD